MRASACARARTVKNSANAISQEHAACMCAKKIAAFGAAVGGATTLKPRSGESLPRSRKSRRKTRRR